MEKTLKKKILVICIFSLIPILAQRPISQRVDCAPDQTAITVQACQDRGCIFDSITEDDELGGAPRCFFGDDYGFKLNGPILPTHTGFVAELVKSGPASFAPHEFTFASLEVEFQTRERIRIKLHPNIPRYEVPINIQADEQRPIDTLYDIQFTETPTFSFQILRKNTGTVIFDSSLGGWTLADQYLQIAARIPSKNFFGLGEHEHPSLMHTMDWKAWPMFAHNYAPNPDFALYGSHPYYTVVEDDGNTHSVLFLNSDFQEIVLTPAPGVIYRTLGGVIDLFFFLGPTPENSVQQYTEAIGRHPLPAYWSLGYHQCRWDYKSSDKMIEAYNRTIAAGIPFDAQWGDIDVLDRKLDFTYDTDNFAGLPEFIDQLHFNERRFVIILDPAISVGEPEGNYPAFEDGQENGVWILDAGGNPLEGVVWPDNPTYFPDFTNPASHEWWTRSLATWRETVVFDGLWIDMNEPTSFINGSSNGCELNKWNMPPYLPKFGRDRIYYKTICMDAYQLGGLHYDTHSMYGWWEAVATRKAMHSVSGERGLVLSRSTFPGAGHYAAHWLGDNWSDWYNMKASIIGMIEFNQFGFPLVGADICGFFMNTTEELCARWHLLGSFYPFSRNHNERYTLDQDPALWAQVAENARKTLRIKYSLLPYLYTLFYEHSARGSTVIRPLWHEFPTDKKSLEMDEQFLWGSSFMIAPALYEGQRSVIVYFPRALWYDFYTREVASFGNESIDTSCPLDFIPLYIRGGAVLATQHPEMTTAATRRNNFKVIVTLDDNGQASGSLYWDDGTRIDEELQFGSLISYLVADNTLSSTVQLQNYEFGLTIEKIEVWGLDQTVADIDIVTSDGSLICTWIQTGIVLDIDCLGASFLALDDWTLTWQFA